MLENSLIQLMEDIRCYWSIDIGNRKILPKRIVCCCCKIILQTILVSRGSCSKYSINQWIELKHLTYLNCTPPSSCPHLIVDPTLSIFRGIDLFGRKYHALSMSWITEKALNSFNRISELNKMFFIWAIFKWQVFVFPESFWRDRIVYDLVKTSNIVIRKSKFFLNLNKWS